MDDSNPCPPPPPIVVVDEFIWSTPVVYGPTLLLATTLFIGIPRYIFVKTHYHLHAEALLSQLSSFSKIIIYLCIFVTTSFVFDAIVIISRAIFDDYWTSSELAFYIGISWLSWVLSLVFLVHESQLFGKWYWTQYIFWEAAFLTETLVGWLWVKGVNKEGTQFTIYDRFSFGIFVTRYIIEILVVILSCIHLLAVNNVIAGPHESSPLLRKQKIRYGAATTVTVETKTYKGFFQKSRKIIPYMWPQNSFKLQSCFIACFLFMMLGFVANLFAPRQIGIVVDQLKTGSIFWTSILLFVGLRFLQGGLQTIQNWLWIPIGLHITRKVSLKTFSHLHHLSFDFHISQKTGDVLRIMDRGTSSVVSLLNQLIFQIVPVWTNVLLISIFTSYMYAPTFGLILFLTMSLYIYVTIAVTERRTKFRKHVKDHANTKMVDSLIHFETVKYYNAEDFEITQYKHAILEYQKADWKSSFTLNALTLAQNAIITGGLLCGCLLFAHAIVKGDLSVGDFVAFNLYLLQLYTPLHWFGMYYRMIQSNLIDMEKMFALLDEVQTVKDSPDARDIVVNEGNIVFDNVTFSYDGRQTALNGMSFEIPKGKTIALVGPSGGGKSTILRLLFRFYDTESGHIYVDGQDIRKVTQASLRKNIGIVAQETVLFNESIYYNINYGNIFASKEDIIRAAKEAQIHQKIETFPDGYDTRVGENGFRLSKSEKQRVAIARTILKNPPIILLDEATGSLDSTNERHIQQALTSVTRGRTTIMIAHRLTTTVNADLILVVKDGKIAESGTHEELINRALIHGERGVYFEMWQKQLHEDTSETFSEITRSSISNSTIDESPTPAVKTKRKSKHRHQHSQQSKQHESQVIEVEEQVHVHHDESSQAQLELIELDEEEEQVKNKSSSKRFFG